MSTYDTTFDISSDTLLPGVIALGVISTISSILVFGLLIYLFAATFIYGKGEDKDDQLILRTHFGVFVVFLFLSDLTQSASGMIQFVWASQKQITPGTLCTVQAVMLQMADIGTAVWNAIIAIHTFWAVVLGRKMTRGAAVSLGLLGWAIILLLTTVGPLAIQTQQGGPFYGVASAWCFITTPYARPRILLHYLPMLLSAGLITVLYVLVALVLFRVLIINGNAWRFEAPTRKSGSILRDFFGQFSWRRLYRTSESVSTQSAVMAQRSDRALSGMPDDTVRGGPKNSPQMTPNREVKRTAAAVSQSDVSGIEDPLSTMSVQLKKLAIKMLWYPAVYLVLILPITVTRIDLSINTSVSVMLGFTCMFLFMGTANVIIFVFTRRLGPAPWTRRVLPAQIKAELGDMQPVSGHRTVSMQIQVDRYTRHGTDDQSFGLPRKKSSASMLTDITTVSSIPPTPHRDLDSKAGGNLSEAPTRRKFSSASWLSDPHQIREHQTSSPEAQEPTSSYSWALPEPPVQQKEQERPREWVYTHPYARP